MALCFTPPLLAQFAASIAVVARRNRNLGVARQKGQKKKKISADTIQWHSQPHPINEFMHSRMF